ncbi:hypothetical protein D4764_0229340 [Xyrichtys novacula]|uniref:SGNH hydrolase-type esterase domain-containing protein n=1 Tax=Xyrichtys novacula TaxID=13765 RepID=A0AAV1F3C5_XYRNO|nr:hypothetical protein D4764_0229340 [Xyrichtys novacula]
MDFSSVATMQNKVIAHLRVYGPEDRSLAGTTNNTTLPWTGSVTTGTLVDARANSHWHLRGARPEISAHSTSCHRSTELRCSTEEDTTATWATSMPIRSREPWTDLPLENRFDILSLHDFPPMVSYGRSNYQGAQLQTNRGRDRRKSRARRASHSATQTAGPILPPPWKSSARYCSSPPPPYHQPTGNMLPGPTCPLRAGGRDLHGPTREGAWRPDILPPGVREVESSALQLSKEHGSATTLVLQAGTNNLKKQQSEVLKQDFSSLVDRLLHTGKHVVISGLLPSPRHRDVSSSRIRQLHLWLKGYCLGRSIPFVDNFTPFFNRLYLFKGDGLYPNWEGLRLLLVNMDLTLHSCTTATS